MTMDYNWITLLTTLCGGGGIVGTVWAVLSRNGRKRDKADADSRVQEAQTLMIHNYEERIKELHNNIQRQNASEKEYIERISQQNRAITDKTEQIRSLTQKLWEAEQGLNRANERITALTEERDHERARADYYEQWQCRSSVCVKGNPDPEGRQPPNAKIIGHKFKEPQ